ncbi:VanW family protein [Paenibacillus segetis]|uniref:G5 domain-containing protein n=1 Tax=Paenibacillus segetis TaxID=1325360 RepID=A0ABQ1YQK0_9BACL|nr:VanW family protein [Paenibacillus segetis]GGH33217.1 hypothetical protein GCM10008013_38160 [Paenibacillus segetis]
MRKIHIILITITSAILLCFVILIALQQYAGQDTVPKGTTVAGMNVGGIKKEDALQILADQFAEMESSTVVFEAPNLQVNLTWREIGVNYDAGKFRAALSTLSEGNLWNRISARKNFPEVWKMNTSYDPKPLLAVFSPDWEKSRFGELVNAVRTIANDDSIHYLPGQPAQRIHWELFSSAIKSASPTSLSEGNNKSMEATVIKIPLQLVQPPVTIDTLKQEGIKRKIAQFSTGLQNSGTGRVYNVEAAAQTIDGMTLPPGGIFDYASVIESAEEVYGFREAPVIFGGKLVPGVGGGICQVSSTLYNAAIRAGLTIVERRNHSLPVSYVPKGQDATFAKGYINFRFKNTSGQHLLIRAQVENGVLTVKLFGDMPQNVTYEIQSRTSKVLPSTNKYVVNKTLPAGAWEIIIQGKEGYIVETYQIKKIDGKVVETRKLSKDTYPSQPTVIAMHDEGSDKGIISPDTNPKRIVEDGVEGPTF